MANLSHFFCRQVIPSLALALIVSSLVSTNFLALLLPPRPLPPPHPRSIVSGDFLASPSQGTQLLYTGVDVMKWTKDTLKSQSQDIEIEGIVREIVNQIHPQYIAISIPMDATADYNSQNRPSPRTAEAFTQKWSDVIHAHGVKVLWRGTWSGIEGIYDFPRRVGANRFPAGTAASAPTDGNATWLGKTYQYIIQHPSFFADGDIWAPLPERTEGIFSDSTSFLPASGAGLQANYAQFMNDLKAVSDAAFAKIGKNVITGLTAQNYSEVASGWLLQSVIDTAGYIVVDHYGITHTPQEMESDLRKIHRERGRPVFLQEWGDYWHPQLSVSERTAYLQSMYGVFEQLASEGILIGFNYWGAWGGSQEGILDSLGSGNFQINYRGQILADFLGGESLASGSPATPAPPAASAPPPPTSPQTPTPPAADIALPSPETVAVPSPQVAPCSQIADNAFYGCYYDNKDFTSLRLTRIDPVIDFEWGQAAPAGNIDAETFSVIWQGNFTFEAGTYDFTVTADDGVRLYLDGELVLDKWFDQPPTTYVATKQFAAGKHLVRLEYYENIVGAVAKLSWQLQDLSSPLPPRPLPPSPPLMTPPPSITVPEPPREEAPVVPTPPTGPPVLSPDLPEIPVDTPVSLPTGRGSGGGGGGASSPSVPAPPSISPPPAPAAAGPAGPPPQTSSQPSVVLPHNTRAGEVIKFPGNPTVYLVRPEGLYPFHNFETYDHYTKTTGWSLRELPGARDPYTVNSVVAAEAAASLPLSYVSGALINDRGTIYIVRGSHRVAFTNFEAFRDLGYRLEDVITGDLSHFPLPDYFVTSAKNPHPWGSWVLHEGTVYYTHSSGLIGVPTWDVFLQNGGQEKLILPINEADLQILGNNPPLPILGPDDPRVYRS